MATPPFGDLIGEVFGAMERGLRRSRFIAPGTAGSQMSGLDTSTGFAT